VRGVLTTAAAAAVGVPIVVNWTEATGWTFVGVFVLLLFTGQVVSARSVRRMAEQYQKQIEDLAKDRDTWRTAYLERDNQKADLVSVLRELVDDAVSDERKQSST
jgi:hypothetical protein